MKKITIQNIIRPSLEISQQELNKEMWSSVAFTTCSYDKENIVGKFEKLQLEVINPFLEKEIWEFTNAHVMLFPNFSKYPSSYILTYDKAKRADSKVLETIGKLEKV